MAITRQKKEEVAGKIEEIAKTANTIVFANFKQLKVNEQNELRRGLRSQGVGYMVAKKTLMQRGLKQFFSTPVEFPGEIAIAYGEDELAPAREFAVFIKKFPEQLSFVGGIFNKKYIGKEEITAIAAIPGMQVLRAQFAQLINSPLQRLVIALDQIAQKQQ